MVVIGDDLFIEILIKLPVLSLLRFKSLSKSWNALIAAPYFIHRHATLEDKLETFIFHYIPNYNFFNDVLHDEDDVVQVDSDRYFLLSGNEFEVFQDLGETPPLLNLSSTVEMGGSCHGIICLHDFYHGSTNGNVYLWNPAMKQCRLLPKSLTPPEVEWRDKLCDVVAFGFDVKARDYKVLRITCFDRGSLHDSRVQVYSLNMDSWRFIDFDPRISTGYISHSTHGGGYVNGKYYFIGNYSDGVSRKMILSFDFSQETFRTILIIDDSDYLKYTFVTSIGDKVSYISYDPTYHQSDIWELNEYCGKEFAHRTKRYTIRSMQPDTYFLGISKDGKIGIVTSQGQTTLKLCNLVTQAVEDIRFVINGNDRIFVIKSDVYKESLVSVGRNNALSCADDNKYNYRRMETSSTEPPCCSGSAKQQ